MTARTAFISSAAAPLAVYQRAEDRLDYALDYADLVADGDSIASSTWESTGSITLDQPSVHGPAIAAVFVSGSGGAVTNTVISAGGRRKSVSFCVLPPPTTSCT